MTLMQGLALLDFARKVIAGELFDKHETARLLLGFALDLVPVDELKPYLSEEARKRDDAVVDVAEAVKVGP